MKLSAIDQSCGKPFNVDVGVNRRTGGKVGFLCMGVGSDQYAAGERALEIRNIQEAAQRKQPLDLTTVEDAAVVANGTGERRLVMAEHCVVGWYGFDDDNDNDAPFDKATLRMVLTRRPHWLDRVLGEIEQERAF